ncbi:hypothetical protein M2165_002776 [Variovorax sp. TBS-050B]|nr:hypothetical protein [Variovorax sp. TBS-050B]
MAMRISASTTISLRDLAATKARPARNLAALALTSSNSGSASGAAMVTAPRAAWARLASIARRAFFQASLGDISRAATMRSAAVRQPSSASRCASQLRRTSSACAWVALPVRSASTRIA